MRLVPAALVCCPALRLDAASKSHTDTGAQGPNPSPSQDIELPQAAPFYSPSCRRGQRSACSNARWARARQQETFVCRGGPPEHMCLRTAAERQDEAAPEPLSSKAFWHNDFRPPSPGGARSKGHGDNCKTQAGVLEALRANARSSHFGRRRSVGKVRPPGIEPGTI